MKRTAFAVLLAAATFIGANTNARCPLIVRSSFHIITDAPNPGLRNVTFNYIGQSNPLASINVTVTVNNDCIDASHAKDEEKTYTSAQFIACNLLNINVGITPYTSGSRNGEATLASTGGASLPVLFSAFSVARNKKLVTLKWETVTEISNSGFAIERNANGNWQQVGFVAAKIMNGNSLQVTGLHTGMFSIRVINRETGTQTNEKIIVAAR